MLVFVCLLACARLPCLLRSEAGSWWYANARLQVTILGIVIWTSESRKLYYTYCSNVLDQSTPFALTCLHDALRRAESDGAALGVKQVMFADCGGHFRSCRFLSDQLICSLQTRPELQESAVHFFAEGHGKGPCDAHFGRMTRYLVMFIA